MKVKTLFLLTLICSGLCAQNNTSCLIKYPVIVNEDQSQNKYEGIDENDVQHIRTLGLSKLDRDKLLKSTSKWVVNYHKSFDCDIFFVSGGEINLFQNEFDLPSYLSLEEKLIFSRLFGSYVLKDMAVNDTSKDGCEGIVYRDGKLQNLLFQGEFPIINGIDDYGMEVYEYDELGNIIYERIVDTVDCSSDVFSFIEKWNLEEGSFEKEIYATGPYVLPKYYVEQTQKLKKAQLLSKDLVYKVLLNKKHDAQDYSIFIHTLFDNLKEGKYEYFLLKDEFPYKIYGPSNKANVESNDNNYDLRKAYDMSLNWKGFRGMDSLGIYPTAILNFGSYPIILEDNGFGDVMYVSDENGDTMYEEQIDSVYYRPEDVGAIEFIEDWYIHEESGELHKKVKGCMLHFKAMEGDIKVGLGAFAPQAVFIRFE